MHTSALHCRSAHRSPTCEFAVAVVYLHVLRLAALNPPHCIPTPLSRVPIRPLSRLLGNIMTVGTLIDFLEYE